jgi:E3 ubiquitin-protein ligase Hakai
MMVDQGKQIAKAQGTEQQSEEAAGVGHIHQRKAGTQAHFCITCSFPVAVFGRLYPCLHAFCIACASEMSDCYM